MGPPGIECGCAWSLQSSQPSAPLQTGPSIPSEQERDVLSNQFRTELSGWLHIRITWGALKKKKKQSWSLPRPIKAKSLGMRPGIRVFQKLPRDYKMQSSVSTSTRGLFGKVRPGSGAFSKQTPSPSLRQVFWEQHTSIMLGWSKARQHGEACHS